MPPPGTNGGAVHPALIQTAILMLLAVGLAAYVLARRERRQLHWLILALLAVIVIWSAGIGIRHADATERFRELSLAGWCLGVAVLPPLWLIVALRFTGSRGWLQGRALALALSVPPLVGILGLATNGAHGLMIRDASYAALTKGASAYAGPLFWPLLAWCYGLLLAGVVVYLRQAARMIRRGETGRGLAVLVGASLPLLVSVPRALGWLPSSFSLTPGAASLSALLLMGVYWRHHLMEIVPVVWQDVIESLPDAVVVTDEHGAMVDLNPAAERLMGCPAEDLRGAQAFGTLTGLAADLDSTEVARSVALLRGASEPVHTRLRLRDGRYLEITGAAVRGRDGDVTGYYGVYRDRTEHRSMESYLHQSQRLETVAGLAAGVAHEVNNPLAYVRANLNHMRSLAEETREASSRKPEELDELRLVVDECIDGVDRIARIVGDMLRFSHLESGGPEPVSAGDVVANAVRLAQLRETGRVEVEVASEPSLPPVWGSEENLVQAVLNLLVNAKHAVAGREDPRIRVHSRVEEADVVVEIRDNGPGVPDELRERIFNPFFTTKGPTEGSGLGLAITAEIARKHGGALELDSASPHGAVFRLRLPAAAPGAEARAASEESRAS